MLKNEKKKYIYISASGVGQINVTISILFLVIYIYFSISLCWQMFLFNTCFFFIPSSSSYIIIIIFINIYQWGRTNKRNYLFFCNLYIFLSKLMLADGFFFSRFKCKFTFKNTFKIEVPLHNLHIAA